MSLNREAKPISKDEPWMGCTIIWTHLLPNPKPLKMPLRTLLWLSLAAAPLTTLNLAAAQSGGEAASATDASLPTLAEATTRAELLELIGEVQSRLEDLGADTPPGAKDSPQVAELRGQLEVLLMQAQLEQLQRENDDLQTQLSETPAQAQGEGEDAAATERQLKQLKARQDNMMKQMQVIAHQHSEILEYSGLEEYEQQTHKVEVGDTLSALAVEYYGNVLRWSEIAAANPSVTDPDLLTPGMDLTIPPKETEDEESAEASN